MVRPDNGDPLVVLPKCVEIIANVYGYTVNDKGYKVLNNVRFIWGDGINQITIESILRTMIDYYGWSADNFAFGMGGALLQAVTRDDQQFAMKASAVRINGKWIDVYKDPVTDSGKKSLKGRVQLYREKDTGNFVTLRVEDAMSHHVCAMNLIYDNGHTFNDIPFEKVRANTKFN